MFAFYSFLDKVSNGLLLFFIMKADAFDNDDPEYMRLVIVLVPLIAGAIAWLCIVFGKA